MKKKYLLFTTFLVLLFISCKQNKIEKVVKKDNIVNTIINDKESFYHIDMVNYPLSDKSLPIGVFDSGIGGLTVLKAIVNYDQNQNSTYESGSDGKLDFDKDLFKKVGVSSRLSTLV